jgi:hypothetical protein
MTEPDPDIIMTDVSTPKGIAVVTFKTTTSPSFF